MVVDNFKCICGVERIQNVQNHLTEQQYEHLLQLRLARDVDINRNMMWCPNTACGKPIISNKGKKRVKCQSCDREACLKCNEAWHPGRSCRSSSKKSLGKLFCQNHVRRCPTCFAKVEREKGEGCMNMVCFRCKTEFCWSCMYPVEMHDKWYFKCPKL